MYDRHSRRCPFIPQIALQPMTFPQTPAYNPPGADLHKFSRLSKGTAHQAHKNLLHLEQNRSLGSFTGALQTTSTHCLQLSPKGPDLHCGQGMPVGLTR